MDIRQELRYITGRYKFSMINFIIKKFINKIKNTNSLKYIHTVKYDSTMQRNELLLQILKY